MKLRKELVGATTTPLLLSILRDAQIHGYEIVRRVNDLSGGVFEWQEGTIYPLLHKMEQSGLIRGSCTTGDNGKRRRVYSITKDGIRLLDDQRAEWSIFSKTVTRILEASHA